MKRSGLAGIEPWRWWAIGAVTIISVALIVGQAVSPALARWMGGSDGEYYRGMVNGFLFCLVSARLLQMARKRFR